MALRTSLAVQPHLYIGDSTGRPLDFGMVYFGEPNKDPEYYPIDLYLDEALTVPLSQPVRTKGGFMNNNGDMIEVYANEQVYSVKVLDSYGVQVFYCESMSRVNTAENITTKILNLNAVSRSQHEKNTDRISVKDFGAKGNGNTDDATAFLLSPDGIYVPSGTYYLGSSAKGRIINPDDDAIFTGPYAGTVKKPYKYADKVPVRGARKALFIGDSLTEKRNSSSYTWYMANHLAHRHGGYAQIGYLPFSSYRTKYDVGNITVANVGMTEMYGASDHKWDQFPYNYSPDGKGWYVEGATGSEEITITLGSNLRFNKLRVFALQTVNGGTFNVSMPKTPDKDKVNYSAVSADNKLGVFDVNPDASEGFSKITISGLQAGKNYYFYGIEIIDNTNLGGFAYNIFARNGIFARDFANLEHIGKYVENLAPDIAFINLGTNDVINGRSISQYKSDMSALISRISAASVGVQIVIIEPTQTSAFASSDRHHEFAVARKELASDVGGYYVDVPSIAGGYNDFHVRGYMESDGVHPNALGKKVIADAVIDALNIPVSSTALYYPVQTEFSNLHDISNIGRLETLPVNTKQPLFSIGLYGGEVDSIINLTITTQLFGSCVVKEVSFYARKYASWIANTTSVVSDVVVVDKYKSPATTLNNFDVFVEIVGNKAVVSITARNWSPTTWTASGTYTTVNRVAKNSGLKISTPT